MKAACVLTAVLLVPGSSTAWAQSSRPAANDVKIDYDQHVKPILAAKCFGCHGPKQQQSGLRLDRRQPALRGGDYGPVITPGNSAESKLIQRITGSEAGLQMPPTGALEDDEIAVLRAWIDQGADMPGRTDTEVEIRRPTDPKVQAFLDAIHASESRAFSSALTTDKGMARAADAAGSTMLMHAAYAGSVEMMATLINAGADVNAANDRRATALHWAITDPTKIRLLLLKGANVNAKTVDGRTPLHLAATLPSGTPIVEMLIEAGADLHARSIVGATPLLASVAASLETTRLLLAKGADPNARNGLGATPLMNAALLGGAATVSLLLDAGADATIRTKRGETALANAANRGDLSSVKLLLDKGADVRNIDYRGYTPLMHAAYADDGTPELIQLLLSKGADVHVVGKGDTAGETAVTIAAKRGETEILRLLRDAAGK
jgi:ankyrin repeat protein/mono/diheme cytochrome c family protein